MHCDSGAAAYEFFSGGGLARLGLGPAWNVVFSNDISPSKGRAYATAFGADVLRVSDVSSLEAKDLPARAALAWASFPCQDLSLAGGRAGLNGARSGAFWGFWRLMEQLAQGDRRPPLLVLENVRGLLTSHGGADFRTLVDVLAKAGYCVGAAEIDARHFSPQSRPRLFIVAAAEAPAPLVASAPNPAIHPRTLVEAASQLPPEVSAAWRWWRLPSFPLSNIRLAEILENASGSPTIGSRLLDLMAPPHRQAVEDRRAERALQVGAAFRRVRIEQGVRRQRAEVRFDGLAGCLRTPAGGSSRQFVVFAGDGRFEARLLTRRECARLMGVPDDYPLPKSETSALHVLGDGVSVPVVRWLSEHLLEPLSRSQSQARLAA